MSNGTDARDGHCSFVKSALIGRQIRPHCENCHESRSGAVPHQRRVRLDAATSRVWACNATRDSDVHHPETLDAVLLSGASVAQRAPYTRWPPADRPPDSSACAHWQTLVRLLEMGHQIGGRAGVTKRPRSLPSGHRSGVAQHARPMADVLMFTALACATRLGRFRRICALQHLHAGFFIAAHHHMALVI